LTSLLTLTTTSSRINYRWTSSSLNTTITIIGIYLDTIGHRPSTNAIASSIGIARSAIGGAFPPNLCRLLILPPYLLQEFPAKSCPERTT